MMPSPGMYELMSTWFAPPAAASGGASEEARAASGASQEGIGAGTKKPLAATAPPWFCRRRPDSCVREGEEGIWKGEAA